MAVVRMRYVKRKASGYYFEPTPAMREAGFRPESLGKEMAAAAARAAILLAEWDAIRSGRAGDPAKPAYGTVKWLVTQFERSPEYRAYKPKTQTEFDRLAVRVVSEFGPFLAKALERRHIKAWHRAMIDEVGADRASRTVKTLHLLLELARDEGLIAVNPASRMKLPAGNRRQTIWTAAEVDALIEAAIVVEKRSIGLAIRLAFDTGQRLGDILTMTWAQYDGQTIRLTQSKTGSSLVIPVLPQLKAMLDATERVDSTQIVTMEASKRPYRVDVFSHRFRELAKAYPDKQFLDLRRSAAVRLAEAGCTTEEVVAITGHQIERGAQILEIYVPRTSKMAASAIEKVNKAGPKVGK